MDENWRVLIVEDDPDIASVLSRGIERAGFTPCLAGDTATAERIAGGGVDAAIVDVILGDDDGRVAAEDALRYMSRHGVHGELRHEAKGMDAPEEVLVRVAGEIGAGLIVMGAFGRTRLRETLFGGVTRFMLDVAPAPLLLVH